jgi:hypothetical protein
MTFVIYTDQPALSSYFLFCGSFNGGFSTMKYEMNEGMIGE